MEEKKEQDLDAANAAEQQKDEATTTDESVSTESTEEASETAADATPSEKETETESTETTAEATDADAETEDESTTEDASSAESAEESDGESELSTYEELLEKAEGIAQSEDWQYGATIINELKDKWNEAEEVISDVYDDLSRRFQKAEQTYFERRKQHYEEQNAERKRNLEKKRELLDQIREIIENKQWGAKNKLRGLQRKWDRIKKIPNEYVEELQKDYNQLISTFEDHRVEYLVEQKQKEELNYEGKLLIIDRMKAFINGLNEDTNWKEADQELDTLIKQWKKIGRVPKSKSFEINDTFNEVRNDFYKQRFEHDKNYRKELEKNEKKFRKLLSRAEQLTEMDDLAEAAREINRLHKEWKETGPVLDELSDELWNQFKAASDAFNAYKSEHMDELKEQEQENLKEKEALAAKAEQLSEDDDWKKTSKALQQLMEDWKKTGPVPRRKGKQVWKKFKKAMDHFYSRKRHHFKEIREEEKENLKKKKALIKQVRELHEHEDAQEALNEVKKLQSQFKNIGYVPIKQKDKIYKQFREACDVIYNRSRSEQSVRIPKDERADLDNDQIKKIKKHKGEINKLKKEAQEINDTILNYSDTKTFIKPNKKGLALRNELDEKINKLQSKLDDINGKIDALDDQIDDIKNEGEEESAS